MLKTKTVRRAFPTRFSHYHLRKKPDDLWRKRHSKSRACRKTLGNGHCRWSASCAGHRRRTGVYSLAMRPRSTDLENRQKPLRDAHLNPTDKAIWMLHRPRSPEGLKKPTGICEETSLEEKAAKAWLRSPLYEAWVWQDICKLEEDIKNGSPIVAKRSTSPSSSWSGCIIILTGIIFYSASKRNSPLCKRTRPVP